MKNIKIIATIKVKPEDYDYMLDQFKQLLVASRQEAGNLRYDLHQATDDKLKFVFVETWQSQEAVDFHNNSQHFVNFLQAIEGKTQEIEIVSLNSISENTA